MNVCGWPHGDLAQQQANRSEESELKTRGIRMHTICIYIVHKIYV